MIALRSMVGPVYWTELGWSRSFDEALTWPDVASALVDLKGLSGLEDLVEVTWVIKNTLDATYLKWWHDDVNSVWSFDRACAKRFATKEEAESWIADRPADQGDCKIVRLVKRVRA